MKVLNSKCQLPEIAQKCFGITYFCMYINFHKQQVWCHVVYSGLRNQARTQCNSFRDTLYTKLKDQDEPKAQIWLYCDYLDELASCQQNSKLILCQSQVDNVLNQSFFQS